MSVNLLILRPFEGARKTSDQAKKLGLTPITDPLFEIRPMPWAAAPAEQYDAIMFTSANTVRYGGDALADYRQLPALAVGAATAKVARSAGFGVAVQGDKGVQPLVDGLTESRFLKILRLSGENYTPVQTDRLIDTVAVYESANIGLGESARDCLTNGSMVLLHSTRVARTLNMEMAHAGIGHNKNHLIAISTNVAEAAGTGWKSTNTAAQPTDEALLTLAARLCSDGNQTRSPNEPGL